MIKKDNQDALNNIVDTFTGGGGVKFISLRNLLELLEAENSKDSNQIIEVMKAFSGLINIAEEIQKLDKP